jgi:hypothetical protein
MKHVTIINKSRWPTDELMPLLRVAWAAASPEFRRPCDERHGLLLTISRTRRRAWCCRILHDSATMAFDDPGARDGHGSAIGSMEVQGMNEIVVALSAWCMVAAKGGSAVAQAVSREAVQSYRASKAQVDAQVAAAAQAKVDREGAKFARAVFKDMERSSLEYRLAQIDKRAKTWERTIKLATTKLKTLRRRRAALIAADTRKRNAKAADMPSTTKDAE